MPTLTAPSSTSLKTSPGTEGRPGLFDQLQDPRVSFFLFLFQKNDIRLTRLAIRTARKRPINYSDRHHFQLHNVDDSESDSDGDGGNEETQEEVELESAEPVAKRRLMVFFNFSPENIQELSKVMVGARCSIIFCNRSNESK